MVLYYAKKCDVCDELVNNADFKNLQEEYQIYRMNVTAGFDIVCPDGETLSERDFLMTKGISALPAVVITDEHGNVTKVENDVSDSKRVLEIGKQYQAKRVEKSTSQTTVDEISWVKLPNGRQISSIYGDMKKGHHVTFIKFSAGLKTKPHTHSNDYVGVVVKGIMRHFEQGNVKTEKLLQPGSIWSVPGNVVHISECTSNVECVFLIHQEHPFDRKVVE